MNQKRAIDLVLIAFLTIGSTLLVWTPFVLRVKNFWGLSYPANGLFTLWQNFDGLNYIAVAKTWYDPGVLAANFSSLGLAPIYFAAHFPLYPAFISLFATIFGFLNSMLFVTVLFSVLAAIMFYILVRDLKLSSDPLFLTIVFLLLPARWLVVRSVGAPEPVFVFALLAAFYFLKKTLPAGRQENFLLVGIFSALAVLTKSPGVLLFLAILVYLLIPTLKLLWQKDFTGALKIIPWKAWPILFAPAALLGLFFWYLQSYGDFFAYFHSGDNIHLFWPPWSIFNKNQFWVGTFWLEHVIFIYLIVAAGAALLFKKKLYDMATFVSFYLLASFFVAHLDITRYLIPTYAFVIIAMESWLTSREFKIVLLILLLPIYLFTQNFILGNIAPIADFSPFR